MTVSAAASPFPAIANENGVIHQRLIPWGVARLHISAWPRWGCARVLRGAVVDAMARALGGAYHSEWCGRDPETGEQTMRRTQICYRMTDRAPIVYAWGERAHDHLRALAAHLRALTVTSREDGGVRVCAVEGIGLQLGIDPCGIDRRRVYRYRLASPFFPTNRQWARRPLEAGWAREWHMQDCLHGSILGLIDSDPISLSQIEGWERGCHLVRVESRGLREDRDGANWRRPERGLETSRAAIIGEFSTNVILPPWMGIGSHTAEGYGICERVGSYNLIDQREDW